MSVYVCTSLTTAPFVREIDVTASSVVRKKRVTRPQEAMELSVGPLHDYDLKRFVLKTRNPAQWK